MELEEAIEELKRTIEENNRLLLPHNEQFFNKKERKEIEEQNNAISAVLQALDGSIPKEKVRKELNDIENMIDKTTRGEIQKYTVGELMLFRTIYNKLLEE